jgi:hypothetical protein
MNVSRVTVTFNFTHMRSCCLLALAAVISCSHKREQVVPDHSLITVGRNVHVSSSHPTWAHDEMILGVDPTNPKHMISCSVINAPEINKRSTAIYTSADGGETWRATKDATHTPQSADPQCIFTTNGTALYLTEIPPVHARAADYNMHVEIYRSNDGGMTWPAMTALDMGGWDRSYFAVDTTRSSPYYGRIYNGAAAFKGGVEDAYVLMYSDDHGATWSKPVKATTSPYLTNWMGSCDVSTDGMLACVVFRRQRAENDEYPFKGPPMPLRQMSATMSVLTSSDGGKTFSQHVITPISFRKLLYSGNIAQLAIDRSTTPFNGRMYVVWEDMHTERTEIYIAHSTDKGKTWSSPALVSDDRTSPGIDPAPWQSMPNIAVTPDGIVGVVWYDRRNDSTATGYMPRFAASLDGGETFTASVPVSERPLTATARDDWPLFASDVDAGSPVISLRMQWSGKHVSGGESLGFVATGPGEFRMVWADNRSGIDQLYTAPITVKGNAIVNGDSTLATLHDVTRQISVDVTRNMHSAGNDTFSIAVRLHNTGKDTITGPLKARVIDVKERTTALYVANADNGKTGAGAVWDFTALLPKGRLLPGDSTGEKVLTFRASRPKGPIITPATRDQPPEMKYGGFNVNLRVLAGG